MRVCACVMPIITRIQALRFAQAAVAEYRETQDQRGPVGSRLRRQVLLETAPISVSGKSFGIANVTFRAAHRAALRAVNRVAARGSARIRARLAGSFFTIFLDSEARIVTTQISVSRGRQAFYRVLTEILREMIQTYYREIEREVEARLNDSNDEIVRNIENEFRKLILRQLGGSTIINLRIG